MNTGVGRARIGQWYTRWDRGELFCVTGCDRECNSIRVQSVAGELDELDEETWEMLPLGLAEPPEDWTGPGDEAENDELGCGATLLVIGEPMGALGAAEEETAEDVAGEAREEIKQEQFGADEGLRR